MKISLKHTGVLLALSIPSLPAIAEMDMGHMNFDSIQMEKMIIKAESTKNEEQRKKYLHEHMGIMMNHMESMSDMMSQHHKLSQNEKHDSERMDKRMDMMQTMMIHMMRQQNMMMEIMK